MEKSVESPCQHPIRSPCCLSGIFRTRAWVEFFILLRDKGEAGAFVDGF